MKVPAPAIGPPAVSIGTWTRTSMKRLHEVKPIWHALIWITAYIVLVNVGDGLSELVGRPKAATIPLLVVLAVALLLYLRRYGWLGRYGLRPLSRQDFRSTLLYAPLLVVAALPWLLNEVRDDLDRTAVLLVCGLMVCVGFIEELLFRGLLFKAVLRRGTLRRAVLIAGVTFGIGHVVNLARGYTGREQILQIGVAVALGIVLTLLFAVTGTIVPLIVFHLLYNIGGSVTAGTPGSELALVVVTVVISAGYALYLVGVLRRSGSTETPGTAVRAEPLGARGRG